jgi:nucleoside-diphosphate-sugar epimerase
MTATKPVQSRCVIIGGSGFIGTRLAARFERAKRDYIIADINPSVRFPEKFIPVDVRSRADLIRVLRPDDIVLNLAAVHRDDVRPLSRYSETNIGGAEVLTEVCNSVGVKHIIFTSSAAVYGRQEGAVDESCLCNPWNEYGRTKMLAEKAFEAWYHDRDEGRTLTILRPTVVFGGGNRGNVFLLLEQLSRPRFVMIGSGQNIKSMAYVNNVAAALEWATHLGQGFRVYNYVDEPSLQIHELVTIVRRALGLSESPALTIPRGAAMFIGYAADLISRPLGRRFPVSAIRVKKFTESSVFSAKSIRHSGFVPQVSLVSALTEVVTHEL